MKVNISQGGDKMKKQIRLMLLKRQTELDKTHCKQCSKNTSKFTNATCEGCKVYDELKDIGDKLLNINNYTINEKGKIVMATLTVERYNELKEKGYTDGKIMTEFGMSNATFYKWKNENGLIGNSKFSKKKSKVDEKSQQQAKEQKIVKESKTVAQNELAVAQEEIKQLRTENDELKKDIKEQIVEIESLEEKVQAYEEEIEKYKQKLSILVKLDSLNRAIKERNEELLAEINKLKEIPIDNIQRIRQLNILLMQELIAQGGKQ